MRGQGQPGFTGDVTPTHADGAPLHTSGAPLLHTLSQHRKCGQGWTQYKGAGMYRCPVLSCVLQASPVRRCARC